MLAENRKPRNRSERMIVNNYMTMRHILELKDKPLTSEMVFQIHREISEDALDIPDGAGRFRRKEEEINVLDIEGTVFHTPPPAAELPARLEAMCDFANGKTPDSFVHPVIRGIILHFWLAYDHPFVTAQWNESGFPDQHFHKLHHARPQLRQERNLCSTYPTASTHRPHSVGCVAFAPTSISQCQQRSHFWPSALETEMEIGSPTLISKCDTLTSSRSNSLSEY